MTSRLFVINYSGSLKKIGTLLFALPLIAMLGSCTEKSAEEKNLHNTLINEYSKTGAGKQSDRTVSGGWYRQYVCCRSLRVVYL